VGINRQTRWNGHLFQQVDKQSSTIAGLQPKMNRTCVLFFCCVVAVGTAQAADDVPSEYRAALLLGNSKYDGFTLDGVGSSLDEVEQALKAQDFRILRRENLTQQDTKAALQEFTKSVPTNGVALVYYIGRPTRTPHDGQPIHHLAKSCRL